LADLADVTTPTAKLGLAPDRVGRHRARHDPRRGWSISRSPSLTGRRSSPISQCWPINRPCSDRWRRTPPVGGCSTRWASGRCGPWRCAGSGPGGVPGPLDRGHRPIVRPIPRATGIACLDVLVIEIDVHALCHSKTGTDRADVLAFVRLPTGCWLERRRRLLLRVANHDRDDQIDHRSVRALGEGGGWSDPPNEEGAPRPGRTGPVEGPVRQGRGSTFGLDVLPAAQPTR
jgi:hypothetical protein